ncbi:DNA-3-methyladenine glycosylase [Tistrella mobilis]|uniref:DNA-3-methyladenine glycosylase II n=1 Tax=Tistrella mobilis TaxID=171437 RepID=A0A162JJU5_9PROT|nr:DNA-3-methyladenine glycosylase [Tistrella mobilis]KYO49342.1 hypothetical protein AUP44_18265 [Tistrella mobilis]
MPADSGAVEAVAPGRIRLPAGIDLVTAFAGLAAHGDDGLVRLDGDRLYTIERIERAPVAVETILIPDARGDLQVTVETGAVDLLEIATRAMAARLHLPGTAFAALAAEDPVIGRIAAAQGVRPTLLYPEPMVVMLRTISAQLVNLAWAATTRRRLAEAFGIRRPVGSGWVIDIDPARIAAIDPDDIKALQFTGAKARAIVSVARAIVDGRLDAAAMAAADTPEIRRRLTAIPGIGDWTADWVLARGLGRPVVATGDLGVRKAVARAYHDAEIISAAEVARTTAHWGEAALDAQTLLLSTLGAAGAEGATPRLARKRAAATPPEEKRP